MIRSYSALSLLLLIVITSFATAAVAQKAGGTWRLSLDENPPSASIHEENTINNLRPYMAVFNNLVLFDQRIARASPDTIRPELATEWKWSKEGTVLTMKLRQGVKWHDGKPFTSADVKCTWDTLRGVRDAGWRKNPHRDWYKNLQEIAPNGEYEVNFKLGRPQPAFLSFLAAGFSPVYPCHVDGRQMRERPIGTGPFKFGSFEQSKSIKLVKNSDYWKPGRPHLDAIEWRIIPSAATRELAFIAGEFDFISIPASKLKEVKAQVPDAQCHSGLSYSTFYLLLNPDVPPLNDIRVRRAMALTLDRKVFGELSDGLTKIGTSMMPPPSGVWGLPPEEMAKLPGYSADVEKNREEARRLMRQAGYGPEKRLKMTMSTRNLMSYKDPAVLVMDWLSKIYVETDLEIQETNTWYANVARKKLVLAVNSQGAGIDDPDNVFSTYNCGGSYNPTNYCDRDIQAKIDEQSTILDPAKRKQLVWEIDRLLQENVVRPILFYNAGVTCERLYVKGYPFFENGQYNHWRFEDIWLDK